MINSFFFQEEDGVFSEDWLDSYLSNTILDAKHEKVNVQGVSKTQTHLTITQQMEIERVLLQKGIA